MTSDEISRWLRETSEAELASLWQRADETRRAHVGDDVHLRGLVEVSNHCARHCHYCGLRADNRAVQRYRLSAEEIVHCARTAVNLGYGTLVLQAGEDYRLTGRWVAELVQLIKAETDLAVTLSLGERRPDELARWRDAGADRYLLRFETSNRALFRHLHPPLARGGRDRLDLLRLLRKLGYEVGSGVMIGIPGQTYADLTRDIELFRELDLDMIGVGPFIPHPDTPLAQQPAPADDDQVPGNEQMTYKVVALTRLLCPDVNIPATTALATLNKADGRELALQRGANIVMPNITPPRYRCQYEIYPDKACLYETAEQCESCIKARILGLSRTIGQGRGDSPNRQKRQTDATAAASRIAS